MARISRKMILLIVAGVIIVLFLHPFWLGMLAVVFGLFWRMPRMWRLPLIVIGVLLMVISFLAALPKVF